MGLHTELPIYKVAYDLLGVVIQLVKNMPRDFKQSVGGTIRDECIRIATLVFRANVATDKAPHLLELLERLARDFASPAIVKAFTREAQRLQEGMVDVAELERARADRADAEKRMARLTASIERMEDPTPLLKRLDEVEKERRAAAERVLRAEDQLAQSRVLETITEADVRQILADLATNMGALDRATLKDALRAWLDKIELDPASRQGRMLYRITLNPVMLASPQRVVPNGAQVLRAAGKPFQLTRPRGIRRAAALT